jgi:hypothetical protein
MHYIKMELRKYFKKVKEQSSYFHNAGILISSKMFRGKILNVASAIKVKIEFQTKGKNIRDRNQRRLLYTSYLSSDQGLDACQMSLQFISQIVDKKL